jgi:hypothetical protein
VIKRLLTLVLAAVLWGGFFAGADAAIEYGDLVCEQTSTTGTGTLDLDGAASGGYIGFLDAGISSGATVPYRITNGSGASRKVEIGWGTFTDATPDTLARNATVTTDDQAAPIDELTLAGTSTVCIGISTDLLTLGDTYGINADTLDDQDWDGRTVAFADAGADAFWGWDDTAGTYENLTSAEAAAVLSGKFDEPGVQTIWVPGGAMTSRETSGSEATTREINSITLGVQAFDSAADEAAQFTVAFPKSWDEGTVTAQAYWTTTGGSASQTVEFEVNCGSIANDAAINVTGLGTAIAITDTWIADNDVHVSSESSAITCSNAAVDTLTVFQILRDISADNLGVDAELIGLKLFYTTDAANDD